MPGKKPDRITGFQFALAAAAAAPIMTLSIVASNAIASSDLPYRTYKPQREEAKEEIKALEQAHHNAGTDTAYAIRQQSFDYKTGELIKGMPARTVGYKTYSALIEEKQHLLNDVYRDGWMISAPFFAGAVLSVVVMSQVILPKVALFFANNMPWVKQPVRDELQRQVDAQKTQAGPGKNIPA